MRIEENRRKDKLCFQIPAIFPYKPMPMENKWRHKESLQLSIPCDVNWDLGLQYNFGEQLSKTDQIHYLWKFLWSGSIIKETINECYAFAVTNLVLQVYALLSPRQHIRLDDSFMFYKRVTIWQCGTWLAYDSEKQLFKTDQFHNIVL